MLRKMESVSDPDSGPGIADALADIADQLSRAGIESAAAEAELILAHVCDASRGRVQALAILGERLSVAQFAQASDLADERARRTPLQHLTGRAPFRGLELAVGPGVFVPRPETEGVAQFAVDALQAVPHPEPLAVDLCTGSGAIALSLAHEVPTARIWAIEKSPEAHAWAARNVHRHGDGRVELILGDAADALALLPPEILGRVNVLVTNPPYVPDDMVPRDPEVRDHDPALALYGGSDGLDVIRVISRVARDVVAPGGLLVIEHAEIQGEAIRTLLTRDGWIGASTHRDLALRDRTTTALR